MAKLGVDEGMVVLMQVKKSALTLFATEIHFWLFPQRQLIVLSLQQQACTGIPGNCWTTPSWLVAGCSHKGKLENATDLPWCEDMGLALGCVSHAHLCDLYWPVPVIIFQVLDSVIEDLEVSWVHFQAGNVIFARVVFILVYDSLQIRTLSAVHTVGVRATP